MTQMKVTVSLRPEQSKGARKRRVRQGFIPGSLYGKGVAPRSIEVAAKSISDLLLSDSKLETELDLEIEGESGITKVVVDDLTRDSISRNYVNIGLKIIGP